MLPSTSVMDRAKAHHLKEIEVLPTLGAQAPGTWCVIGEHTDEFGGTVVVSPLDLATAVVLSPRHDGVLSLRGEFAGTNIPSVTVRIRHAATNSAVLQRAARLITTLIQRQILSRDTAGFDITVCSDVPLGSGLGALHSFDAALGLALYPEAHSPAEAPLRTRLASICSQAVRSLPGTQVLRARHIAALRGISGRPCVVNYSDGSVTDSLPLHSSRMVALAIGAPHSGMEPARGNAENPVSSKANATGTTAQPTIPADQSSTAEPPTDHSTVPTQPTTRPAAPTSSTAPTASTAPGLPEHASPGNTASRSTPASTQRRFIEDAAHAFGTEYLRLLPDSTPRVLDWLKAVYAVHDPQGYPSVEEASGLLRFWEEETQRSHHLVSLLRGRRGGEVPALLNESRLATVAAYGTASPALTNLTQACLELSAASVRPTRSGVSEWVAVLVEEDKAAAFRQNITQQDISRENIVEKDGATSTPQTTNSQPVSPVSVIPLHPGETARAYEFPA
ncbi:galactokinase family protein [Corynebacterium sp. 22KM0430]|uniref:galactokinase family protein n=1 Tax=Corynebacterium sp. 22KM0430 TaxID=2989735 RepID=UPI0029C9E08E|nr:galactokinase family protein [Corynebacterium sp. 22KM0430]WPF65508.1 galactokinase family protein [Corynebacterium sp. 22KM0430]